MCFFTCGHDSHGTTVCDVSVTRIMIPSRVFELGMPQCMDPVKAVGKRSTLTHWMWNKTSSSSRSKMNDSTPMFVLLFDRLGGLLSA